MERPKEFDSQLLQCRTPLLRYALKLTRDRNEAEDLVSDTLTKALVRWEQCRAGCMQAWLYTIMRHRFFDLKKAHNKKRTSLFSEMHEIPDIEALESVDQRLSPELMAALKRLPPYLRTAVVLFDLEDMSHKEIASLLNTTLGASKNRVFKGRRLLREYLTGATTTS